MMEDTLIFVDNGFFKLVKKEIEKETKKKKRFLQTFRNICKKEKLHLKHLFFYTSPPYQSEIPTNQEKILIKNYNYLLNIFRYKKWITLREGRCQRLKIDEKFVYKQKGVDILISMDLMEIINKHPLIKKVILIACDSDFVPVIKNIQKKGVKVILYTYFVKKRGSKFSRYNELLKICSKWVKLTEKDFEDVSLEKYKNKKNNTK